MKTLTVAAALQLLYVISRNYLCGNELQTKHAKRERHRELIQNKQALTQNHLYVLCMCAFVCLFVCIPFFVVLVVAVWFSFLFMRCVNSTRYYVKHFTCVRTRIICHEYES